MPRIQLTYEVPDVSAAARSLRDQLTKLQRLPSHVELLNMLARAAGYRNFQHFRAEAAAAPPAAGAEPVDRDLIEKTARHFDSAGRLIRWPARDKQAILCLFVLWSRIKPGESFTEREISELLDEWHTFGDHALLRRALVDYGLMSRTVDGSKYVRIGQKPPAELPALLKQLA
jgi:hypothetical protein